MFLWKMCFGCVVLMCFVTCVVIAWPECIFCKVCVCVVKQFIVKENCSRLFGLILFKFFNFLSFQKPYPKLSTPKSKKQTIPKEDNSKLIWFPNARQCSSETNNVVDFESNSVQLTIIRRKQKSCKLRSNSNS